MPASLADFAAVNDRAAATTKKLEKQAILADYFRTLADDADLCHAVRFAGGRTFAATDERITNVGGKTFSDAVLELTGINDGVWHDLVVRSGEIGEALAKLWVDRPLAAESPLALDELAATFDALAMTNERAAKAALLQATLARCTSPREAAYFGKITFGDLRTGVQAGVLQAAIGAAFDRPAADVNRAQLLVGDLGDVAVLARHDALASAAFTLFHPIQFMLASPRETARDAAETIAGRTFFAEDKLDGIRAQVHKQGDGEAARVHIYTRTMDRTDESFPDVADAVRQLPGDFLLDGEIVPYRDAVVLPFAHIQRRLGRKELSPDVLAENPCTFIAFDMLFQNGTLLMDHPLVERRAALEHLARVSPGETHAALQRHATTSEGSSDVVESGAADPIIAHPRHRSAIPPLLLTRIGRVSTAMEIQSAFAAARASRNEGLVLKDAASPYSPGRSGQMWLKLKTHLPTLDCVVTAAEFGHGKRRDSLSDYTFAVWDREPTEEGATLVNIGKAYSGVTDEEIAALTKLFMDIATARHGRVFAVRPQVVMEIACDQVQQSDRHASGYALRFPRIKRIRQDKKPEDADRLARVKEIFTSKANFAQAGELVPAAKKPRAKAAAKRKAPAVPTLFDGL